MIRRVTHAALALLALGLPALAQPLPERVPIGDGHMTVGFELKTTTHASNGEGRTDAHSLMRYIVPKPDFSWSEAERAQVERWGDMSVRERTAFFFESYKGGYNSTNFEVDVARYPMLDRTVSWYGHMNIPHVEVRSQPFDSPREAMEVMERLKADVRETIAFHVHVRFPDTTVAGRAEAITDWLRRASWAITLKRADYSSRTDFVLKSMDNQPVDPTELEKALRAFSSENPGPAKDIIERRGLRVSRLADGNGGTALDIEFRGLMRDTDRIRDYLRLASSSFGEGRFGPWGYGPDTPIRNANSNGAINFRSFGLNGAGSWSSGELEWLANSVEESRSRFGVETSIAPEELREAVKRLATADTEAGKKMLLPSSFNWLFLPIEFDPALPEGVQEQVERQKARYLRKLVRLAERVHAGEFGRPGQPGYEPLAVASRTRRILYDFVNERYTDASRSGKLFEWYELSLRAPQEVEERTRRWRGESGRDRSAEWSERLAELRGGEGFAPRRTAAGPAREASWSRAEVDAIFRATRDAAVARLRERVEALAPAERAELLESAARPGRAGLVAETTNDVGARWVESPGEVRITTGLLNALDAAAERLPEAERAAFRRRALGIVFGHELSHAGGIRAERAADAEAIRVLERSGLTDRAPSPAELAALLSAFGQGRLSLWEHARGLFRYGTTAGRLTELSRAARGEADPYAAYRRADGTIDWRRAAGDRALREAGGLLHFGLALFLKELAVVAQTGDQVRIQEFFDGLLTTDFYTHYGMFVLGARAGDVAYARYLQRFIKPRFVSSILRTNVALAAGLALPQLASGTFEGKAFAISLTSLGLSSAAVKSGVASIRWVHDLSRARRTGSLGRLGLGASRFARLGGWFYTAAELAVVLYVAEDIEERVHDWLDARAAREALADATDSLLAAAGAPDATPERVAEAADRYHQAWTDYRDFLYRPLHEAEVRFAARLERAAREAKLAADEHAAALARVESQPALRASIERRYGSVEAYAEHLTSESEAEVAADVEAYTRSYAAERAEHLRAVYEDDRRGSPLLGDLAGDTWLLSGARAGAPGDPVGARSDWFADRTRGRHRARLRDALEGASGNRLEAYEDEAEVLSAVARALRSGGREDLAASLDETRELVERTHRMDADLFASDDGLVTAPARAGVTDAVAEIGGE